MNPVPLINSIIITTSSCSLVVKTRCRLYVAGYLRKHGTTFADDTVDSVHCGPEDYRECVRQRGRPTFPRANKTRSITTGAEKGAEPKTEQPMREPSCGILAELRRATTWYRWNLSVVSELIVIVQIDLSREEVRRFPE